MPNARWECVKDIEGESSGTCEREHLSYSFAAAGMQGWRPNMEDTYIANPGNLRDNSLFAVFDGHGGPLVSEIVKDQFEEVLKSSTVEDE